MSAEENRKQTRQIRIFGAALLALTILTLWHDPRSFTVQDLMILPGQAILLVLSFFRILAALKQAPYSLRLFHWFFVYFFWGVAPVAKLIVHQNDWNLHKTTEEAVLANAVLILWCLFFMIGENLAERKRSVPLEAADTAEERTADTTSVSSEDPGDQKTAPWSFRQEAGILAIAALTVTALKLILIGVPDPFSRGYFYTGILNPSSPFGQILYKGQAGLLAISVAACYKSRRITWIPLLALLLFCNSPLSESRYLTAAIYLGLVIVFASDRRLPRTWLAWLLTGAITIVYPILEHFRYGSLKDFSLIESLKSVLQNMQGVYQTEQFENWSMMAYTIRYTRLYGYSFGRQLLGTLGFWIPRSLWTGKPIGSGATIFQKFHWGFTNVSCPMPAEGYIDLGAVGVIILALLTAFLASTADGRDRHQMAAYPFLLPFSIFLLRGDLMSSAAYMVGFFAPVLAFVFLAGMIRGRRVHRRARSSLEISGLFSRKDLLHRGILLLCSAVLGAVLFISVLFFVNGRSALSPERIEKKRADLQMIRAHTEQERDDAESRRDRSTDEEERQEAVRIYWNTYNQVIELDYLIGEIRADDHEWQEYEQLRAGQLPQGWIFPGVLLGVGVAGVWQSRQRENKSGSL